MKKQVDQNGFSAVMVVLIFVLVGIIGFTGWYVWNRNRTSKISSYKECTEQSDAIIQESSPEKCVVNGQTFTNPEQTISSKPSTTPTVSPSPAAKYLVIKEWGVQVPLTSEIQDLSYSILGNGLYLSSAKFATLSNNECTLKNKDYLGHVIRSNDPNYQDKSKAISKINGVVKVGEYYYLYSKPIQMYCQQDPPNQTQINYFQSTVPIVEKAFSQIQQGE